MNTLKFDAVKRQKAKISAVLRVIVAVYLGYLGITIDEEANHKRGEEIEITTSDSKVKVMVISTNEELAIARQTVALV